MFGIMIVFSVPVSFTFECKSFFFNIVQEAETDKLRLSVDGDALRTTISELKAQKDALNRSISELKEGKNIAEQGKAFYMSETEKMLGQNKELEQERDFYKKEMVKVQGERAEMEQERDYYKDEMFKVQGQKANMEQERDFYKDQSGEVLFLCFQPFLILSLFACHSISCVPYSVRHKGSLC